MKQICYAVDDEDGLIYSRVGDQVAVPVLDFAGIGMGGVEKETGKVFEKGNFQGPTNYNLEKFPLHSLSPSWGNLRWTKKIPTAVKNLHRAFWGMKPLKADAQAWYVYVLRCANGALYVGITTDVERRLAEHNAGKGSKYVRSHLPATVACSLVVTGKNDALVLEAHLKRLRKAQKEEFVKSCQKEVA